MSSLKEVAAFIIHPVGICLRDYAETWRTATNTKILSDHRVVMDWRNNVAVWFVKDNRGSFRRNDENDDDPIVRCRVYVNQAFVGLRLTALTALLDMTDEFIVNMSILLGGP